MTTHHVTSRAARRGIRPAVAAALATCVTPGHGRRRRSHLCRCHRRAWLIGAI